MKNKEMNDLVAKTNEAKIEYDNYNTVVAIHTVTVEGQTMTLQEVKGGQIKANGSEIFRNLEEMKGCLQPGAELTTEYIKQ